MIENYTHSLEVLHNVSMNPEMDSELVKLAVMTNVFSNTRNTKLKMKVIILQLNR